MSANDARKDAVRRAAEDPSLIELRSSLAQYISGVFREVGEKFHVFGHMLGTDRREGLSPFGHGDDAAVAVSMLLRISSELVFGSHALISVGKVYAGSALIRQLVEVEYLAWAFETNHSDASKWLRSTRDERRAMFSPDKIRRSSDGRFRSEDYGYHCELGGHPVPTSWRLLNEDRGIAQLMISDAIGHSEHIWRHVIGWATAHSLAELVAGTADDTRDRYENWQAVDPLATLPPPPNA